MGRFGCAALKSRRANFLRLANSQTAHRRPRSTRSLRILLVPYSPQLTRTSLSDSSTLPQVRSFSSLPRLVSLTPSSFTGNCLHSILAHLDGVTSLCFLSSGTSLASVGHDTSLRFWNLDLVCTQEIASHRATSTEGILDVIAGEEVVVSAGADGTVRLWVRE